MEYRENKRNNFKKICVSLLMVILLWSGSGAVLFSSPKPAQAQASGVITGGLTGAAGCALAGVLGDALQNVTNIAGNFLGSITGGLLGGEEVPVNDTTNNTKECVLDGLVKGFAKALLREITANIVNWILTGFEGNPFFVTDLKQFIRDAADQTIGEFIYGSELSFLCSPFELDVRLALALTVEPYENQIECTLSDALGNVDAFFSGSFQEGGGWGQWFEVTTKRQNNPYGAAILAETELAARVQEKETNVRQTVSIGDGFLPYEKCETVPGGSPDQPGSQPGVPNERCYTTTPGQTISKHLSFELQSGELQLLEADEIDEAITAVVGALAQRALSEIGLLGLLDGPLGEFQDAPNNPSAEELGGGGSEGGR